MWWSSTRPQDLLVDLSSSPPNLKRNPLRAKKFLPNPSPSLPAEWQLPLHSISRLRNRGTDPECIFPEIIATKKILQPPENSGLSACHGPSYAQVSLVLRGRTVLLFNFFLSKSERKCPKLYKHIPLKSTLLNWSLWDQSGPGLVWIEARAMYVGTGWVVKSGLPPSFDCQKSWFMGRMWVGMARITFFAQVEINLICLKLSFGTIEDPSRFSLE